MEMFSENNFGITLNRFNHVIRINKKKVGNKKVNILIPGNGIQPWTERASYLTVVENRWSRKSVRLPRQQVERVRIAAVGAAEDMPEPWGPAED